MNRNSHYYYNRALPFGVKVLQQLTDKCCPRLHFNREFCYRGSVVFLTYIAYMCYHLSRKPISVVKTVLHRNCTNIKPPGTISAVTLITLHNNSPDDHNWCDWAPFNGTDASASQLLGALDSSFLFCYAIAMFASGFVAERVNLRFFLAFGMIFSGIFSYLFGIGKTYNIHHLGYYVVVQGLAGIAQTTGWPGVVTVMSNWFGKSKRGLIFGLWNSHTSIGNILGSLIAAEYVETDWALSFIMPGLIIALTGFILFMFLVVNPGDVGCTALSAPTPTSIDSINSQRNYRKLENQVANVVSSDDDDDGISSETDDTAIVVGEQAVLKRHSYYLTEDEFEVQRRLLTERTQLLPTSSGVPPATDDRLITTSGGETAIGFLGALRIPGVIEFSLCLFFSKLVSYTFLYWLPLYVNASTTMGATLSADLSTLFDVGGIIGAIAAGVISDHSDMPATTCVAMFALSAPMMFTYQKFSGVSLGVNMFLLIVVGLLVNGPYALITTAVSAELGTHSSLDGNAKALATVTAIIDGTGSIGAAVGPLLAGFVSTYGWRYVFFMLIASDLIALLMLTRLCNHELKRCRRGGGGGGDDSNIRIRVE